MNYLKYQIITMILFLIAVLSLYEDIHIIYYIIVLALFSILIMASILRWVRCIRRVNIIIDIIEFLTLFPISLLLWIQEEKEISSLVLLEICYIKLLEISPKKSLLITLYLIGHESQCLFIQLNREDCVNYVIIISYSVQILIKIIELFFNYQKIKKQQIKNKKSNQVNINLESHNHDQYQNIDCYKLILNLYEKQKFILLDYNLQLKENNFDFQKILKNELIQKEDEFNQILKLQCLLKDNSNPKSLSDILNQIVDQQTKFQYCIKVQKGLITHTILFQIILIPNMKNILIHILRFENYADKEKSEKEQLLVDICKSLSHNLGTNLNSIQTFSFNSLEDEQINQYIKEAYIKPIYENSQQLNLIISNLRDYNLIQLDQFNLMLEPFTISEEIEIIQRLFKQAIEKKKIYVKNEIHDINAINDRQRFRQVYFQLFSNAIKFTENGIIRTEVRKFTSKNQQFHQIIVSDTGIGMNELEILKLKGIITTGRFLRVSEHSVGSGLGICISNQIIKYLSGRNQLLHFEPQNQGTKFIMNMKIFEQDYLENSSICEPANSIENNNNFKRASRKVQSQLKILKDRHSYVERISSLDHIKELNSLNSNQIYFRQNESHQELLNSQFQQSEFRIQFPPQFIPKLLGHFENHNYQYDDCCSKILVADDEIFNIKCLEMILQKYTKKVDSVFNGQEVMKQIQKKHQLPCSICQNQYYQIIFLDINMPVLDGIKTAQKISDLIERDVIQKPCMIANSGFCDLETKQKAYDAGVDYYFTKPIDQKRLQSLVKDLIIEYNYKN